MNAPMNRIIPIVGVVMLVVAGAVGLRACKKSEPPPPPAPMTQLPEAPAPDVDTPADTVRTLSAQVADLLDSTEKLTEENRMLREQATALLDRQTRIDERIRSQVQQALARNNQDADSLVADLAAKVDQLSARVQGLPSALQGGGPSPAPGADDLPVGFGGEEAPIHWIESLDAGETSMPPAPKDDRVPGLDRLLPDDGKSPKDRLAALAQARATSLGERTLAEPEPVYTIPANSTLAGATAFTALVGRIPISGQVQDPVPFKALIGADNLAANGHEIPGLAGMVVAGYAVGDWTLSCASGRITSATFIFEDGRVVTFGARTVEPGKPGQGSQNRKNQTELGWISDRFGTPCVVGKRVTNAPQYLAQRVGLGTMEAAAAAAAASQTTTIYSPAGGGTASAVTGDQTQYVLGQAASKGVGEINKWLTERQAQSFDAIYVRPGAPITVHIDVNLPIDRDPAGRMVDHRLARNTGETRHAPLD